MPSGISRALKVISGSALDSEAKDGDTVDRLNYKLIHGLLIFFAIFTATKQYVGTPIYCWLPANYIEKFQRKFANNYCWVQPMYNVPFEDSIPVMEEKRHFNDVSYYRWGTMMYILLASLFRIPHILWKEMKKFSGANIDKLITMTAETTMMDQEKRDEQLGHVAEFVHRWVTTRHISNRNGHFAFILRLLSNSTICYGKRSGHNLVFTYLFVKFLYLLNSVSQFFIISAFLKTSYWTFGIDAMSSYAQNGQWEDESVFPRVALCDMKVRVLANVQIYTIQCVLGMNLFLEKFFFILWFCLVLMIIANTASFTRWAVLLLQEAKTVEFLAQYSGYFLPKKATTEEDKQLYLAMARRYLKADGVFLIRMIAENSTDLLTVDLIRQIWLRYRTYHAGELKKITREFPKLGGDSKKIDGDFQTSSEENKRNGTIEHRIDEVDK